MPHVIVKMYAGKTNAQKQRIADEVTKTIMNVTGHDTDAVSVSIEDIAPAEWMDTVYEPDISNKPATLYKKPGYGPAR